MDKIKNYSKYVRELFSLSIPMIVGNLGIVLVTAGDVFVAARHSTNTLAAVSIANSIISTIFLFGIGLLASISPLLSNFRGAKEDAEKYFLPTVAFSQVIALISVLVMLAFVPFLEFLHFESKLVPIMKQFMIVCSFSTFGAYLQAALREYLQAFEVVVFPNFLNFFGVFLNLFLCFIFVFGWFGCPEFGAVGLAYATLFTRTLLGLWMFIYALRFAKIRIYRDFGYYFNLLKIGFPIAAAILLEVFAFNIITIAVGQVSGVYAAAQNILLTISTATFMIPMAIANAIAIKVGFANGAGNYVDMKNYAYAGVSVSVGFMAFCALCFILFPDFFVNIFTKDVDLVKICVPIMFLMGLFQIFDGMQVSLGGVFKGLKRTKLIMIGCFIAYWVIGLPLGFLLAFKFDMNLYGFWVGLSVSICSLALIFLFILMRLMRRGYKD